MIQSSHNLRSAPVALPRPFGIRVSLKTNDPFRRILGPDWTRVHWYHSADDRDAALAEMARKHEYSRPGDQPTLVFTRIEKVAESRGL